MYFIYYSRTKFVKLRVEGVAKNCCADKVSSEYF